MKHTAMCIRFMRDGGGEVVERETNRVKGALFKGDYDAIPAALAIPENTSQIGTALSY
jgi:hypothetical protein